jgi:hypothetical protein
MLDIYNQQGYHLRHIADDLRHFHVFSPTITWSTYLLKTHINRQLEYSIDSAFWCISII